MLCYSHLSIISILLAASSSTPFVPRDNGALVDLDEKVMEPLKNFKAPAVPRQVYTGHHGQADEQALATEAPLPIPTARNIYDPDNEKYGAAYHHPRHAAVVLEEPSSTLFCPLPPQTVKATVISTITMIMNVATLWPHPIIEPRQFYTADDDDAPPIPTADLLLNHLKVRDEDWKMPLFEGMGSNDELQGDDLVPYSPGGVIVKATPPLVPALGTATSTESPFEPALSTDSSSSTNFVAEVSLIPLVQEGCTTTMLGNLARPCQANGAVTVYTSTVTSYAAVDCGTCTSLHVVQPKWGCPFMSVLTEVTDGCPYTSTSYLCSGATTPSDTTATETATLGSLASLATPALWSLPGVAPESAASVVAMDTV